MVNNPQGPIIVNGYRPNVSGFNIHALPLKITNNSRIDNPVIEDNFLRVNLGLCP